VAGYDLLNEPEVSRPAGELTPLYDELVAETVTAIREGEAQAPFEHIVFVEPAIPAGDPSRGLVVPDPARIGMAPDNIVAAPHNYAESIDNGLGLTIEGTNDLFISVANGLGVPVWVGEYGFWDTSDETMELVRRFAADQDRRVVGGAWWQWRQACGDPHSITWGEPPSGSVVHLNLLECPGDVDRGPNEDFLDVLGRGYPRAAPGRISSLESDPATGRLAVVADGAAEGAELVVWTPTTAETHEVTGSGLADIDETAVSGGRLVTARITTPSYELLIEPAAG
jgi:endoglycosylceramidase